MGSNEVAVRALAVVQQHFGLAALRGRNPKPVTMADAAPVPTSAVLMTAWTHIATKCTAPNKAFMQCKAGDSDPAACLAKGDEVSRCALSVLKELNDSCSQEFNAYAKCMDYNSNEFESCRTEQKKFEAGCPM